jgi:nitric oxide reductase large subunit
MTPDQIAQANDAVIAWTIGIICVLLAVGAFAYVCDQYTKRHKPNRRKGLPAPSKDSTRYATPQAVP